jgi:hypothetical protein
MIEPPARSASFVAETVSSVSPLRGRHLGRRDRSVESGRPVRSDLSDYSCLEQRPRNIDVRRIILPSKGRFRLFQENFAGVHLRVDGDDAEFRIFGFRKGEPNTVREAEAFEKKIGSGFGKASDPIFLLHASGSGQRSRWRNRAEENFTL